MFQKTRIQLTVVNSIVFFILISIVASVIYSYFQATLYKDADESLLSVLELAEEGTIIRSGPPNRPYGHDPREYLLIWQSDTGELIYSPFDFNRPLSGRESEFLPKTFDKFQEIEINGLYYRTYAREITKQNVTFTIQAARIIDSEKEMLNRLLLILVIGVVGSGLLAVVAGFFLAGQALVPIKKAWLKQQQFVSDASHELRTPLTVIQMRTDLLLRSPDATIEEKAVDVSTISKETRRLSRMVTNLLTLTRSDSDQIEIIMKEFSLDALLQEVIEQYEDIAAYQEKELTLETLENIQITADKEKIHQLLVILLDNAMKFTEPKGHIILSCKQTAHSVDLIVKDDGTGIEAEDIPKIFNRFFQGSKSRSNSEGTGLGLSIAEWIVEKHQGKMKVQSKIGEGSTFIVTLPQK